MNKRNWCDRAAAAMMDAAQQLETINNYHEKDNSFAPYDAEDDLK